MISWINSIFYPLFYFSLRQILWFENWWNLFDFLSDLLQLEFVNFLGLSYVRSLKFYELRLDLLLHDEELKVSNMTTFVTFIIVIISSYSEYVDVDCCYSCLLEKLLHMIVVNWYCLHRLNWLNFSINDLRA